MLLLSQALSQQAVHNGQGLLQVVALHGLLLTGMSVL